MKNIKTETLPNGLTIAERGARMEVCLDRPWQHNLADHIRPATCPFENGKLGKAAEEFPDTEWLALDKKNKTGYHKLILPPECWSEEKLQALGGVGGIKKVLDVTNRLITRDRVKEAVLIFQVGWGGGQSLGHPHAHLRTLHRRVERRRIDAFLARLWHSDLEVQSDGHWRATLGGDNTGQCFILPRHPTHCSDENQREALGVIVSSILEVYNVRFRSTQGMAPDFSLSFILRNSLIEYASYVPILYHAGAYNKLASLEECPIELAWPHVVTCNHLLE